MDERIRVKVIRKFRDKLDSYKIKKTGEIIEVTKERYKELTTSPFGVFVEKLELVVDVEVDLEVMTKKELVEYAKNKGIELDMKMNKKEMIKGLM